MKVEKKREMEHYPTSGNYRNRCSFVLRQTTVNDVIRITHSYGWITMEMEKINIKCKILRKCSSDIITKYLKFNLQQNRRDSCVCAILNN